MTIDFKKSFVDFTGNEILEGERPKMISESLCFTLFYLSQMNGTIVSAEMKYTAYRICKKITDKPEEVELTTEEGSFLKEVCGESYSAGAYGQIVDIIEQKI